MFIDGMIHNPLEWFLVALFALFLCGVGGIIIGGLIELGDWILERRKGRKRNAGS